MTAFFFKGIPEYRMKGFVPVRNTFDNLNNILHLAEIINTCSHCRIENYADDFDFVLFTGSYCRALIKKQDGFFSMAIPFQIIDEGDSIFFNFDVISEPVSGQFISIIRNSILAAKEDYFSHDKIVFNLFEDFGLDPSDAMRYLDAFIELISSDHGYFRFDDDQKNENGDIHPRFHFDFFYKNTSAIKIGYDKPVDIDCFYALFDNVRPKRYLS